LGAAAKVEDEILTGAEHRDELQSAMRARGRDEGIKQLEFERELAEKRGASEADLFRLTEQIEAAKRDAAIAAETERFEAVADTTDRVGFLYEEMEKEHKQAIDGIIADFKRGETLRRVEYQRTHDWTTKLGASMMGMWDATTQAASKAFVDMLFSTASWKDKTKSLLEELKETFKSILADMLNYYINYFLRAIINRAIAAGLGNLLGGALSGGATTSGAPSIGAGTLSPARPSGGGVGWSGGSINFGTGWGSGGGFSGVPTNAGGGVSMHTGGAVPGQGARHAVLLGGEEVWSRGTAMRLGHNTSVMTSALNSYNSYASSVDPNARRGGSSVTIAPVFNGMRVSEAREFVREELIPMVIEVLQDSGELRTTMSRTLD